MILKLGGAAITDKRRPFRARKAVIGRLAGEVAEASPGELLIIHGGGSFGHPLAERYKLTAGYREKRQLLGFAETRLAMGALNRLLVEAFVSRGVSAVGIQPSAFIQTRGGRIKAFNSQILERLLQLGLTPILYGDVVMDEKLGFTVLSGDRLAVKCALSLGAGRVIFASDVDGLYERDPKVHPNAKLLRQVDLSQLKPMARRLGEPGEGGVSDVTGAMAGKLREITPLLKRGIIVHIINALRPRVLFKALRGEKTTGTLLRAGLQR